ncbi:MAG: hypothetical protein J0I47_02995 [Sphingomonas sp.]|uniref:hypothetical protein n=1 Tax=Sphingomonas sp. TaxID=28214 RepID=UPI001AD022D2|nr:hypothetical protein [Sphingomonas sp.]MBN8807193.1 hypothetical protein [Sphingomonas sp.]
MIFFKLSEQERKNATIALTFMVAPVVLISRTIAASHGTTIATVFVAAMAIVGALIGVQIHLSSRQDAAASASSVDQDSIDG